MAKRDTTPKPTNSDEIFNFERIETAEKQTKVIKKLVDQVTIYEVKEHELEILESGRQSDIFLNFAVFCLSSALTCLVALLTVTFNSDFVQMAFFCVVFIGFIIGGILLILWYKGKDSVKRVIETIKSRNE